ncbi:MAG: hypothetical protein KJ718_03280 [Nanoarchaeota archaeon]|nr:hypothetical protein [Nanoarchaeota archaeon]MBU1051551.1 hypothetical protein [Nanoarchaeota archaeon]MBU1988424.1 hypothetical protein [Nanoarchaeota archaeon]
MKNETNTLVSFSLGAGIGICIIAAYLMVKGYVNWGIVTLIIGVVMISVSSLKKRENAKRRQNKE